MARKPPMPLIQTDAVKANANRATAKGKGHSPALALPARKRKHSQAITGLVCVANLPKMKGGREAAMLHHLGLHPRSKGDAWAVICFTHGTAAFGTTRHSITMGGLYCSARDVRTAGMKARSGDGCPIAWCDGCVSALTASA